MGTSSWFVRPETLTLSLSDGQWILVKRRLTAGEWRAHLRRSSILGDDGARRLDLFEHRLSLVVAYLVDWSLGEAPIRGVSTEELIGVLDTLEESRFLEMAEAIEAHDTAATAARAQEKKVPATTGADPTSPSPSAVDGALSGSASLT